MAKAPKRKVAPQKSPGIEHTTSVWDAARALAKLLSLGSAAAVAAAQRYVKSGPGEYAEHDRFIGVRAPQLRALARDMRGAGLEVALPLLKSGWHEARSLALLLLVQAFERADPATQKRIYEAYLKSTQFVNGWDLVDVSAAPILGAFLDGKPALRKRILDKLAKSDSLWERRIAMVATYHYIKKGEFSETFRIAEILLKDQEDLIHKAVGWMLREVGDRVSEAEEESFLKRHYKAMPRTMLRYAIEKFSAPKRKRYLAGLV